MAAGKKSATARWRLVIDTSIFQAASERPAPDPMGKICADLLEKIRSICHQAVFSPESSSEWKGHRSRFALTWRRTMTARKKLHLVDESCRNDELREALEKLWEVERGAPDSWEEVEKDLHLVEAALVTDKIVLSRDRRIRECLKWACKRRGARILREVHWIDPVKNPRRLTRLLKGELPRRSRLGS